MSEGYVVKFTIARSSTVLIIIIQVFKAIQRDHYQSNFEYRIYFALVSSIPNYYYYHPHINYNSNFKRLMKNINEVYSRILKRYINMFNYSFRSQINYIMNIFDVLLCRLFQFYICTTVRADDSLLHITTQLFLYSMIGRLSRLQLNLSFTC